MFDLDEEPAVDLTPLIDVVFMLLVFFIMTASFSRPVLDIVLPQAERGETPARQEELLIVIKADGSMLHGGGAVEKAALPELLRSRPEALLTLHVDEKAPFEAFVAVVDLAKEVRGGRFVISTQTPAAR